MMKKHILISYWNQVVKLTVVFTLVVGNFFSIHAEADPAQQARVIYNESFKIEIQPTPQNEIMSTSPSAIRQMAYNDLQLSAQQIQNLNTYNVQDIYSLDSIMKPPQDVAKLSAKMGQKELEAWLNNQYNSAAQNINPANQTPLISDAILELQLAKDVQSIYETKGQLEVTIVQDNGATKKLTFKGQDLLNAKEFIDMTYNTGDRQRFEISERINRTQDIVEQINAEFQWRMMNLTPTQNSFKSAAKKWGPESIYFFIALGMGASLQLFTNYADNPVSMQQHLEQLKDPVSHLAFYFFMVANNATNQALMRSVMGKSNMRGFIPYLGMSAGLLADRSFRDIWAATQDPDMQKCVRTLFSRNKINNIKNSAVGFMMEDPCDVAYVKWVKHKVYEYIPAFGSLMLSTYLAGKLTQYAGVAKQKIIDRLIKTNATRKAILFLGMQGLFTFTPGGWVARGGQFIFKAGMHLTNIFMFTQIDHAIAPFVNKPLQNLLQPGDIDKSVADLSRMLNHKIKNGWKPESKGELCYSDFSSPSTARSGMPIRKCLPEIPQQLKQLRLYTKKWREFNLEEIMAAYTNWQKNIANVVALYNLSSKFYPFFIEYQRDVALQKSYQKQSENGPQLSQSRLAQPILTETTSEFYGITPLIVSDYSLEALEKAVEKEEKLKLLKRDDQKQIYTVEIDNSNRRIQDAYRTSPKTIIKGRLARIASVAEYLNKEIKTSKLSPAHKSIVQGIAQDLNAMTYLPDINGPKKVASAIERIIQYKTMPIGSRNLMPSDILFTIIMNDAYKKLGQPDPTMGKGRSLIEAFNQHSAYAEHTQGVSVDYKEGKFKTQSPLDYIVVMMACGPDRNQTLIEHPWGFTSYFIPPRITKGPRPSFCDSWIPTQSSKDIYTYSFSALDKNNKMVQYTGLVDYIQQNLDIPAGLAANQYTEIANYYKKIFDQNMERAFFKFSTDYKKITDNFIKKLNDKLKLTNALNIFNTSNISNNHVELLKNEISLNLQVIDIVLNSARYQKIKNDPLSAELKKVLNIDLAQAPQPENSVEEKDPIKQILASVKKDKVSEEDQELLVEQATQVRLTPQQIEHEAELSNEPRKPHLAEQTDKLTKGYSTTFASFKNTPHGKKFYLEHLALAKALKDLMKVLTSLNYDGSQYTEEEFTQLVNQVTIPIMIMRTLEMDIYSRSILEATFQNIEEIIKDVHQVWAIIHSVNYEKYKNSNDIDTQLNGNGTDLKKVEASLEKLMTTQKGNASPTLPYSKN